MMIWGYLVHLSYNMWRDREVPGVPVHLSFKPYLRFDEPFWEELCVSMRDAGVNMVVIDLGDGVRYDTHPEIAVQGAWSTERLREELQKLRQLGLEPIPKLNFSATHDLWLGPYARQVSTDVYYRVCADLIQEVIDLFDKPRFFHLGMDEETAQHQREYEYVVIRQYDLWWHDCLFLIKQVQDGGARPWLWSDYMWHHRDEFIARMPKDVLQSNWWYDETLKPELVQVQAYMELAKAGYEQIPTASNYNNSKNFEATVEFVRANHLEKSVLGILQTPWKPTQEEFRQAHKEAVEQVARGRALWESQR